MRNRDLRKALEIICRALTNSSFDRSCDFGHITILDSQTMGGRLAIEPEWSTEKQCRRPLNLVTYALNQSNPVHQFRFSLSFIIVLLKSYFDFIGHTERAVFYKKIRLTDPVYESPARLLLLRQARNPSLDGISRYG